MRLHPTPLANTISSPRPRASPGIAPLVPALRAGPGLDPSTQLPPDALVVTTGQQAGLFTGPLYTVFKALSAAALAAVLEERWQRPVRPLFWVPGDDHDFEEVATARWVDDTGAIQATRLPPRPASAELRPMWREPLGPGLADALAAFSEALPAAPHRDAVHGWLARHYRPEATVAEAYTGAMAELLSPFGVLCVESTHPAFKRAASPLMLEAARRAEAIEGVLAARAEALAAAGATVRVDVADGASLLFLEEDGRRDRLVREGSGFRTRRGGTRYTLSDLEAIAEAEPTRLSPNVLLRPVVESAVLPTVAYVAGPGELSYFRLLPGLYDLLEVPAQEPVPRWSGAVIEAHADRLLAKFSTTPEEVGADFPGLERRILRHHLPPEVPARLGDLAASAEDAFGALEAPLLDVDPTMTGPLAAARRQVDWALRDLERKALSRLRARESVEVSQLRRLQAALHPGGRAQERALTIAPFLARHGPPLLAEIHGAARSWYAAALEGAAGSP